MSLSGELRGGPCLIEKKGIDMRPTITLSIVSGPLEGLEYVFQEPCKHVIGRADDCTIQLPKDVMHATVSRGRVPPVSELLKKRSPTPRS